jgi:hypothetical protein
MYEVVNQGRGGAGGGRPQYTPDQLAAIEKYPGELLNAGGGRPEQTPEQLAAIEKYNKDLADFRKSNAAIDGWATFGKKLNEAGIDVHLFKFEAGQTDELLDYSFAACKAVGALGITTEGSEQKCASFGKVAERNGSLAVYHNHGQYANMTIAEIEKWLDMSPANRLNFDCVHYFGFGYDKGPILSPTEFIEHFHDRIISLHIKDKTSSKNPVTPNTNQVWGQGETPLKEILTFVRDKYPQIYCDVELEYMVSQWSTPEAEIKKCVEYARQILLLD